MAKMPEFTGKPDGLRDKFNLMSKAIEPLTSITGDGLILVNAAASGITLRLDINALLARIPKYIDDSFDAVILESTHMNGEGTAHATDPSTQWSYLFAEVVKTGDLHAGWTQLSGGRTGTAYNRIEIPNTTITVGDGNADQRMGNGVILEHLDYDGDGIYEFTPMPAQDDVVYRMTPSVRMNGSVPSIEYWFSDNNGIDGGCD